MVKKTISSKTCFSNTSMIIILLLLTIIVGLCYFFYHKYKKISIFGYGSLMSIKSVQSTMPNANNFRPGTLNNYMRIFSLINRNENKNNYENEHSKEIAILSVKSKKNSSIKGIIFDIPVYELNNFFEREKNYTIKKLNVIDNNKLHSCYVCLENENEYINSINSIKKLNCGSDMKPEQNYLLMCLNVILNINDYNLSFRNSKMEYIKNFFDHCYLADCKTTIRQYMKQNLSKFPEKFYYYL